MLSAIIPVTDMSGRLHELSVRGGLSPRGAAERRAVDAQSWAGLPRRAGAAAAATGAAASADGGSGAAAGAATVWVVAATVCVGAGVCVSAGLGGSRAR
jgi:hypothetical protein